MFPYILLKPTIKLGVMTGKMIFMVTNLQLRHIYRAIDFLDENKDTIEQRLFYRHMDLFSGQLDLVFFDTKSTYVEGPEECLIS